MSWCLQTKYSEHQTNAPQASAEGNPSGAAKLSKIAQYIFVPLSFD
jgi:type III secretion system FlhB-like substrate exporter